METPPSGTGPQPYAQYPRARPPRLTIDVIGDAFQVFAKQPKVWALAALPFAIILGALSTYIYVDAFFSPEWGKDLVQEVTKEIVVSLVQQIVFTAVTLFGLAGLTRMAMRQLDGLPIQPSDAFKVGDRLIPLLVASFVISMLSAIGLCLCIIPYFLVLGLSLLVVPIIVMQGAGPFEAIARSIETLKGHLWPAAGIALVLLIISGFGGAFCIGFLVTLPGIAITFALIYREFFPNPTLGADV